MDNNQGNNNLNMQPNLGNEILMGDTPDTNLNMQPQNNLNLNQSINQQQSPINQSVQNVDTVSSISSQTVIETPTQNVGENNQDINTIFSEPTVEPQSVQQTNIEPTPQPEAQQKKNKGPVIIIVLLLLIVLGLAGYIVYDKFLTTPKPTTDDTSIIEDTSSNLLLKDKTKEVVYDYVSDDVYKEHKVPNINIDSETAETYNKSILSFYDEFINASTSLPTNYNFNYQYYVNGDIVSIKVSYSTESSTVTHSKIFNINQVTGKEVDDSELLSYVGINEEEFAEKLVESYKTARPLESLENSDTWKDSYQKDIDTFTNKNIKGIYLNNNELYVLFELNYPAGAEVAEALLNVTSNKVILNPVTLK